MDTPAPGLGPTTTSGKQQPPLYSPDSGVSQPPNSRETEQLDNELARQIGLRQGLPVKALITSVQVEADKWSALLKLTLNPTADADATQTQALIRIISALPLHRGQLLTVMLDSENRLQVLSDNATTNSTIPEELMLSLAAHKTRLAPFLAQISKEESRPLGQLLQKLVEFTSQQEQSDGAYDAITRLLRNIPETTDTQKLTQSIETWVKNNTSINKNILDQTESNSTNSKNKLPNKATEELLTIFFKSITGLNVSMEGPTLHEAAIRKLVRYLVEIAAQKQSIHHKSTKENIFQDQTYNRDINSLSSIIQSLISRLNTLHSHNHINNINNQENSQIFKLDMPLWNNNQIHNVVLILEKEYDKHKEKTGKRYLNRWRIFMEFDLGKSGKLEAEALVRENSVNISLWAEEKNTHNEIQSRLKSFNDRLIKQGVPVEGIHCRSEKSKKQNHYKTSHQFSLINIQG